MWSSQICLCITVPIRYMCKCLMTLLHTPWLDCLDMCLFPLITCPGKNYVLIMSLHHPYLTCAHVVHIQPNDWDARIVCNKVSRHFMSLLLPFVIKRAIVMCTHTEYISSLMTWTQTIRLSEYSCWTIFNFVSPKLLHFKCARLGSTYPA